MLLLSTLLLLPMLVTSLLLRLLLRQQLLPAIIRFEVDAAHKFTKKHTKNKDAKKVTIVVFVTSHSPVVVPLARLLFWCFSPSFP